MLCEHVHTRNRVSRCLSFSFGDFVFHHHLRCHWCSRTRTARRDEYLMRTADAEEGSGGLQAERKLLRTVTIIGAPINDSEEGQSDRATRNRIRRRKWGRENLRRRRFSASSGGKREGFKIVSEGRMAFVLMRSEQQVLRRVAVVPLETAEPESGVSGSESERAANAHTRPGAGSKTVEKCLL